MGNVTRRGVLLAVALVPALAAGVALSGCSATSTSPEPGASGKLAVIATTTQIGDLVRSVGGDAVTVHQILKPNVDPHEYEPTPADIASIGTATVVVKNGIGLEPWLDQTLSAAGFTGTTVDASTGITLRHGDEGDDPHIWHNPRNVVTMAATIADAFIKADSGHADQYRAQLKSYQDKLIELDASITAKLATIPPAQRVLVTNHDAFGYYIDHYQLKFIGSIIPSFDTSAELSGTAIEQLVAKIKSTGVKAVFSESSLPPKTAQAIAERAGIKVEAGDDSLFADTLGPAGSSGSTIIDSLTHNTDVIVKALT